MVGIEIIRFFEILGKKLDPSALWYSVMRIEEDKHDEIGSLEMVEGLTLILRLPARSDRWRIVERTGLLTVYGGLRVRDPRLTELRRVPRLSLFPKPATTAA